MIKRICLLIVISFLGVRVYSQKKEVEYNNRLDLEQIRGNEECRLSGGKCKDIIELLCIAYNNDSVAVEIFKREYEIVDMRGDEKEWLLGRKNIEILQYFTTEQNNCYNCRLKKFNYPQLDLFINH